MPLFLSSNIHQGDEHFSVESRGRQCALMSLSAVLTARNIPLTGWSRTTVDNVLLQGGKMYLEALNGSLIVDVGFLSVDNLPKAVGASCCQSMFSYEILDYCIRKIPCLLHSHTLSAKATAD